MNRENSGMKLDVVLVKTSNPEAMAKFFLCDLQMNRVHLCYLMFCTLLRFLSKSKPLNSYIFLHIQYLFLPFIAFFISPIEMISYKYLCCVAHSVYYVYFRFLFRVKKKWANIRLIVNICEHMCTAKSLWNGRRRLCWLMCAAKLISIIFDHCRLMRVWC